MLVVDFQLVVLVLTINDHVDVKNSSYPVLCGVRTRMNHVHKIFNIGIKHLITSAFIIILSNNLTNSCKLELVCQRLTSFIYKKEFRLEKKIDSIFKVLYKVNILYITIYKNKNQL